MSVELIAEVASNHGGSIELAKEFIHRFADAGATWVKFQTTRVKHLRPDDPQFAWFQRAELSDEAHWELKAACASAGVKMLTTVYHAAEVPFVASLGLGAIKIGSGEAGEVPLAEALMNLEQPFPRVLVATGLTRAQSTAAWRVAMGHRPNARGFYQTLRFLGCITRYPAPPGFAIAQLTDSTGWMTTGPQAFLTGWSDHAVGPSECQAAMMTGAVIIEKHVQLPHQARPCQPWEATVEEFKQLRAFADADPARFLGRWQHA